ncbi:MAG: MerR family transcriptional regulator [Erythrobacter sp.]|nr:MerR family transcriptional regulator [Erythrobacter sp.]RZV34334.1 MAG: MerR family transcriptional regulator [Sphingomonadaceae bacterium]
MTTFDDGKDDSALRTIGEVGSALGLKPHVLRYWEEQFPTLQPLKRSGNRRYYRAADVALIETIHRLVNNEGYTLKGARQAIEEGRVQLGERPSHTSTNAEEGSGSSKPDRQSQSPNESVGKDRKADGAPVAAGQAVPAEVVAQLKDIRERLAAAVGA